MTSVFLRYLYNYLDNFHILGTLPVYGYTENKVNELNKWIYGCIYFEHLELVSVCIDNNSMKRENKGYLDPSGKIWFEVN